MKCIRQGDDLVRCMQKDYPGIFVKDGLRV